MIIGKLIKPCKICLYTTSAEGGEIESFTLLKLNLQEYTSLLFKAINMQEGVEYPLDGSIVLKYSGNDELHQEWKNIAEAHMKNTPQNFVDVSKEFKSKISGTSCLIRDPKNHIIRIARRNGDDKVTINRLCIGNDIRERFFQDVKTSKLFKLTNKYAMDIGDMEIYTYWSKFMNSSFIEQSREAAEEK